MSTRDRDPTGRPRNSRPRDSAGRPLPHGAEGVQRVDEDVVLDPADTVREAQRLLDAGYPFHAHEVLEAAWKAADGAQRNMWKGLAQLAVGLTHVQRGNAKGAVALLRRGAEGISSFTEPAPHGLDLAGLVSYATALADRIEGSGTGGLSDEDVRPKLTVNQAAAATGPPWSGTPATPPPGRSRR